MSVAAEQMRTSTLKVKEVLGSGLTCTDKDIQDALWNYYYDVGKTISYLTSQQPCPTTCTHCS